MGTPRHALTCAIFVFAISAVLRPALGAPLSLQDCRKLEQEQAGLTSQGVLADLEKGPEWVKTNLPANRVTRALRYLRIYEQVRFRCENIFAAEGAREVKRLAQQAARAKALANIPPPPGKRPEITFASTKTGVIRIPPLPARASR